MKLRKLRALRGGGATVNGQQQQQPQGGNFSNIFYEQLLQ